MTVDGVSMAKLRELAELPSATGMPLPVDPTTVLWLLDRIEAARWLIGNAALSGWTEWNAGADAWLASVEETP